MNAIITKYICPTNFKGARISARIYNGFKIRARVIISWDDSLAPEENHIKARQKLQEVLGDEYQKIMHERYSCPWLTEKWAIADLKSFEMVHIAVRK